MRFTRSWGAAALSVAAALAVAGCAGSSAPAGSGGAASGTTGAPSHASSAPAPAPPPAPASPQDQAASQGWKLADAFAEDSPYGTAVKGDVTNISSKSKSGVFTLVVRGSNGKEVARTSGAANSVPAGATVPVTFIGAPANLPGAPFTYSLTVDISY